MTSLNKQQLKDEIRNIFNLSLKKIFEKRQIYGYHCDIVDIYLQPSYICLYFKDDESHLHLNYVGEIITDVYTDYTVNILRQQLKLLKKLVLYMI